MVFRALWNFIGPILSWHYMLARSTGGNIVVIWVSGNWGEAFIDVLEDLVPVVPPLITMPLSQPWQVCWEPAPLGFYQACPVHLSAVWSPHCLSHSFLLDSGVVKIFHEIGEFDNMLALFGQDRGHVGDWGLGHSKRSLRCLLLSEIVLSAGPLKPKSTFFF